MGRQEQLPPQNYLHFWIKIGDFGLKERIPKQKGKSLTSGSSQHYSLQCPPI